MSSQAVRIETETLRRLRARSVQGGEPIARLAQRYIDEGMRLDRHAGVVFRDGPAGRRAVLIGGPDVWEVISAVNGSAERGEALIQATAERVGIPLERVRTAIDYYADYPGEVDQRIEANQQAATEYERFLESRRRILG